MTASRFNFRVWDGTSFTVFDAREAITDGNYDYGVYGDPMIFMQSTGLTDKNGKEIFEGDVVRHVDRRRKSAYVVVWDCQVTGGCDDSQCVECGQCETYGGMPGWYLKTRNRFDVLHSRIEIIGDIYQNPDMVQ